MGSGGHFFVVARGLKGCMKFRVHVLKDNLCSLANHADNTRLDDTKRSR